MPLMPAVKPRKSPSTSPLPPLPLAVPLSVMKMRMVLSAMLSSLSLLRSRPTL